MSAPKGNQFALKADAEKNESFLHVAITRQQKASYVRAANARRLKLAAWVKEHLDRAAD